MFTPLNTTQLCISAIDGDLEFERSGSDSPYVLCMNHEENRYVINHIDNKQFEMWYF